MGMRFFGCLTAVTLIVLAGWQLQRQELAWAISDIVIAALLLALLSRREP